MAGDNQQYHFTPLSTYLRVYVILLVLTVITVIAAQFHFGIFNTFIAMAIATLKIWYVVGYFMGMKHEGKLNIVTISSTLVFIVIFVGYIAIDVASRKYFSNYNSILKPAPNTKATTDGKTVKEEPSSESTTPKQ
jgi:cytochrome c oxidase subunit 4